MNEQQFVTKREPDWQRLTVLCAKADASPTQLTSTELREFFRLYKRVSNDLSAVRTKSSNIQLAQFLNDLLASAYGTLYRTQSRPFGQAILSAIAISAQTVRRRFGAVALSAALFFGSAIFANMILRFVPESRDHFVSAQWQETVKHWRDGEMEERNFSGSGMMTGFYLSNNPRASIITGALAASTFGVMTAKLLYDNGALLGALAYEVEPVGRVGYLLIHVFPHGVPELSGIIVAGSAGFVMALALIAPGRRTRGQALKENGKDAIVLLCTATVLMFIAAPIEGFFSFNPRVPDWLRGFVILVSCVAWTMFWIGYGRTDEEKSFGTDFRRARA